MSQVAIPLEERKTAATTKSSESLDPLQFRILGVPISVTNLNGATATILNWARAGCVRAVFVRDVHGLMIARKNSTLLQLHEQADLVVPDGAPLVWVGRWRGLGPSISRTAGADLMEDICRKSASEQLRHYFFGGKTGIAEDMAARLCARYPGLKVVGVYSPPMREVGAVAPFSNEELQEIENIGNLTPDFVWVGLSSPKQEYWMMKAKQYLPHGVLIGVGAAFDFHSGAVVRAPKWMRNNGFEWLHRLITEPRRLWRRYLLLAPLFVCRVLHEQITGRFAPPSKYSDTWPSE